MTGEITVKKVGATSATTHIQWISMTHWIGTPIERYVSVPGGRGLGRSFLQGYDNAVTTITGYALWNANGTAEVDGLQGAMVEVTTDAEGTRTGRATITLTGSSGAYVNFTMSVREEDP